MLKREAPSEIIIFSDNLLKLSEIDKDLSVYLTFQFLSKEFDLLLYTVKGQGFKTQNPLISCIKYILSKNLVAIKATPGQAQSFARRNSDHAERCFYFFEKNKDSDDLKNKAIKWIKKNAPKEFQKKLLN